MPKTYIEKLTELNNAIGLLKYNVLIALPFIDESMVTLKQQIVREYPQPYCNDRYGFCETNEVCYCNRQLCPNPDCEQLLSTYGFDDTIINCSHCGAKITII